MNMTEKRYTIRRIKEIADVKLRDIHHDFEGVSYIRSEKQILTPEEITAGIEAGELIFQDISDILDMIKQGHSSAISKEKLFTEGSVNKLKKKLFKGWAALIEGRKKKLDEIAEDSIKLQDEVMLEGGTLLMTLSEFKNKKY